MRLVNILAQTCNLPRLRKLVICMEQLVEGRTSLPAHCGGELTPEGPWVDGQVMGCSEC